MKKYLPLFFIAGFLCCTACNDFLSEYPTKNTNEPVQRIEQLVALLDNPTYTERFRYTDLVSTDNFELPFDLYDAYPNGWTASSLPYYILDIDGVAERPSDMFWSDTYSEIYQANLILEQVDKVSGDAALKAQVKAEAHFLRGYSNLMMVTTYCMPYHPDNFNDLGLPRKTTTSAEETLNRMTLKETYDFIEEDFEEALKVTKEAPGTTHRPDNRATINALLSRHYLYKGEYDNAITAADNALNHSGIIQLIDYTNLGPGTPIIYANPADTIKYCEIRDYAAPTYFNWKESFYIRVSYKNVDWIVASQSLLDMFDKNYDLRYKWFFLNESRKYGLVNFPNVHSYANAFGGYFMLSGVTIQEVMLNKAEALLRKSSPDIAGAMALVNQLREHRMLPHADRTLTAANANDALLKVLAERRKEFPYTLRWQDIRRFAYTETTIDDVVVSHDFYEYNDGIVNKSVIKTYTLPLKSRRYAVPINKLEVDKTKGQFEQNTY